MQFEPDAALRQCQNRVAADEPAKSLRLTRMQAGYRLII